MMVGMMSHEDQEGTGGDRDPENHRPATNMNSDEAISDRSGHREIGIDQHDLD